MHVSTLFLMVFASILVTFTFAEASDKESSMTGVDNQGTLSNIYEKRESRKKMLVRNSRREERSGNSLAARLSVVEARAEFRETKEASNLGIVKLSASRTAVGAKFEIMDDQDL